MKFSVTIENSFIHFVRCHTTPCSKLLSIWSLRQNHILVHNCIYTVTGHQYICNILKLVCSDFLPKLFFYNLYACSEECGDVRDKAHNPCLLVTICEFSGVEPLIYYVLIINTFKSIIWNCCMFIAEVSILLHYPPLSIYSVLMACILVQPYTSTCPSAAWRVISLWNWELDVRSSTRLLGRALRVLSSWASHYSLWSSKCNIPKGKHLRTHVWHVPCSRPVVIGWDVARLRGEGRRCTSSLPLSPLSLFFSLLQKFHTTTNSE